MLFTPKNHHMMSTRPETRASLTVSSEIQIEEGEVIPSLPFPGKTYRHQQQDY